MSEIRTGVLLREVAYLTVKPYMGSDLGTMHYKAPAGTKVTIHGENQPENDRYYGGRHLHWGYVMGYSVGLEEGVDFAFDETGNSRESGD